MSFFSRLGYKPVTANTFTRAFSSDHVLLNTDNYTDSWGKELIRFLSFIFTVGITEYLHHQHAEEKMAAFVPILKNIVDTSVSEGDGPSLELTTFAGKILIVEKHDDQGVASLEASLDGVKFETGEFNTIQQLKDIINRNLAKNKAITDQYPGYSEKIATQYAETNEEIARFNEQLPQLNERDPGQFIKREPVKEIKTIEDVATVMQKNWRFMRQTMVCEAGGEVPFVRYPNGEPVAVKLPGTGNGCRLVALPSVSLDHGPKGGFKKVTHRDPENKTTRYVRIKFKDPSRAESYLSNSAIIYKLGLKQIKPQIKVNETELIAEDLGELNLFEQASKNLYQFDCSHWLPLANDIERLHASNWVHRDIKPANIFFKDGYMVLTDNDMMGEVGNFECDAGTPGYLTSDFMRYGDDNETDRKATGNPFSKDQYTFFNSMMAAHFRRHPPKGGFTTKQINDFVNQKMPCDSQRKRELISFLCFPVRCLLSRPLRDYLENGSLLRNNTTKENI